MPKRGESEHDRQRTHRAERNRASEHARDLQAQLDTAVEALKAIWSQAERYGRIEEIADEVLSPPHSSGGGES